MKIWKKHRDLSEGFAPAMLVDLVREQVPELPWLPQALLECGPGNWESRAYVSYVSRENPNEPQSLWQFETNVIVEHKKFGTLVLDILKGQRLGGIEFLNRIDTKK